jgi:hypothetical protein
MRRQPRDRAGRWIKIEHDAPDSPMSLLGACILIVLFMAAAWFL